MIQHNPPHKRWTIAWTSALLLHLIILALIAWSQLPDNLVHVSHTVPMPNQTVELMPAQGLEPAVFFSGNLENLNNEAVLLYEVQEDGSRNLISTAHIHPKRNNGLQFDAISNPGTYEIVILDGELGLNPNFDGELIQLLPSGDGKPGGAFTMQFKLASKVHEVMTATLYEPDKPMLNEESAYRSEQQQIKEPEKTLPIQPPPQPQQNKQKQPKQQKPIPEKLTSPVIQENSSPVESGEPETNEPSIIQLKPEDLRITPYNLAPELLMESAENAQKNFEQRDTNKWVNEAAIAKQRFESAYNPDGPVIGIGQRGNSVEHKKSVAEYLALMHLQIHPLWAYGYLVRLDTIYRQPGSPVNNPDIEAIVEITMDSLGKVIDVRMVRTSGITEYDNEAIHVAWNSSPDVPPPAEMRSDNGKSYIHWTFWRDSRQCGVFGVKVYKLNKSSKDMLDFSLKAVQLEEQKLGLKPSVIQLPGSKNNTKNNTNNNDDETQSESNDAPALPEKINPMDD